MTLLTFFFDGVPAEDTITDPDAGFPEADPDSIAGEEVLVAQNILQQYNHYPYQERECAFCHDQSSLGRMVEPEPAVCYQCHEDFNDTYAYLHGPVAGGYCTSCHNPHVSENEHLLLRTGQALCLHCHDPGSVFKNEMHEDLGDWACTECHNAHGGEDRFIFN
jgi:predicted CXXCH cytochrome family protein